MELTKVMEKGLLSYKVIEIKEILIFCPYTIIEIAYRKGNKLKKKIFKIKYDITYRNRNITYHPKKEEVNKFRKQLDDILSEKYNNTRKAIRKEIPRVLR